MPPSSRKSDTTPAATDAAFGEFEPAAPAPELSYEQARAALEDVVRRLEAGGIPLEESLALWEQGETLAQVCQSRLDGARARLDAVLGHTDQV